MQKSEAPPEGVFLLARWQIKVHSPVFAQAGVALSPGTERRTHMYGKYSGFVSNPKIQMWTRILTTATRAANTSEAMGFFYPSRIALHAGVANRYGKTEEGEEKTTEGQQSLQRYGNMN